MRIISPFKDYYDSAQAYGIDPDLNYYRQPKVIESVQLEDYFPLPDINYGLGYWNVMLASTALLIVCGKLYPFLLPHDLLKFDTNRALIHQSSGSLTMSRDDPRIVGNTAELPIKDRSYWLKIVNDYFDGIEEARGQDVGPKIHREVYAPVIVTRINRPSWWLSGKSEPVQLLTNPRLANFGFQSILDPFTCFQEIAQYLGNELAQPDTAPLRTGDEKIILRAKGFDEQSFRTAAPGHKKLNRKANRAKKKKSE